MPFNKDIITRGVLGITLFVIFAKVVGPVLIELLKRKIPGAYNPENDIDSMIRRQKERLRAEYSLTDQKETSSSVVSAERIHVSREVEKIYKESHWGGGDFAKNIQAEISKSYSYTLAETKVNAFVLLAEKRNYLRFLSADNQSSPEAIKNFLSLVMLFLILIEEIRTKEFNLLTRVAKKCHAEPSLFMLALQLKILFVISSKREIREERLFDSALTLHHYAEDTMKEAVDMILRKEANFWAKGHSLFFEELSLYLNYADLLLPLPLLKNKNDVTTAYEILKANPEMELEEIKKVYKKLAMTRHPDKIGQMQLPKALEKKAAAKFAQIQQAFEIITTHRKK